MSRSKAVIKTEGPTELERSIIRQVEYYFGDYNIPRDTYLQWQIQLHDGWLPLEILKNFNRLARLSKDSEEIAQALLKSTSGLLVLSDDNKKLRRNPEFPIPVMTAERRREISDRTLYAKGFPTDASIDDLLKFFHKFDEGVTITLRKFQDLNIRRRLFKGSLFATFNTKKQAAKFIALKGMKYEESDLLILWQNDYMKKKREENEIRMNIQKEDAARAKRVGKGKAINIPTGSVLRFRKGSNRITRKDIKEALTAVGFEVAYVDADDGDTKGLVRLAKQDSAKEFIKRITDGRVRIAGVDIVFKRLEEEEETRYLNKTAEEKRKYRRMVDITKREKSLKGKGEKRKLEHTYNDVYYRPSKSKRDNRGFSMGSYRE